MSFTPSPQQAAAILAIIDWFRNRTHLQQVFRLFGFAGTGKSTIVRHTVDALGLMSEAEVRAAVSRVLFAAFTGKAALVMSRKGAPASTIHSLIYRVSEATTEEIERVEKELSDLRQQLGNMGPAERAFAELQISKLQLRLVGIHQPKFVLNAQSMIRDADLVILDEISMVGNDMAADLLAFGKPILVLGDPGQLPPIKGIGAFISAAPDVMLTEIHRQAEKSAIVRLATLARQDQAIPYGEHDTCVWKMRRDAVASRQLLKGSQVICGLNASRLRLNASMKQAAGLPGVYPEGRNEKIICLKNRHDLGLINGMFVTLTDIEHEGPLAFSATVTTDDGDVIGGRQRFYKGHFDDHVHPDPGRARRDWWDTRGLIETTWGYAITCHKAQGSQYGAVIVLDDGWGRSTEDRSRWLYTAITRAEWGLVIVE